MLRNDRSETPTTLIKETRSSPTVKIVPFATEAEIIIIYSAEGCRIKIRNSSDGYFRGKCPILMWSRNAVLDQQLDFNRWSRTASV